MSIKKYFIIYFSFLLFFILSLACFNAFVDPYLILGTSRVNGINKKKPKSINRTRLFKPYQILKASPTTVIAGNSRPEMGINPESQCWPEAMQPVYSLTFPGLGTYAQARSLFHAIATEKVKYIFWGLDFIDFLNLRTKKTKFTIWPNRNSDFFNRLKVDAYYQPNKDYYLSRTKDYALSLLSLDAVLDSLFTIVTQSDTSPDRTDLGFNPANEYKAIVEHEGTWVLFQQKLDLLTTIFTKPGMSLYDTSQSWSLELESVKRIIDLAQQKNIQLTLFINPYHYSYLDIIKSHDYWDEFENYKRELKELVALYGHNSVFLWDFSQYSEYTTSAIPNKNNPKELKWFWEPAHYKASLGNLMLQQMLNTVCENQESNALPGINLMLTNINKYLQKQRIYTTNP